MWGPQSSQPGSHRQQVKAAPGQGGVGDGPPACLPCPRVGWHSHSQANVLSKDFAFAGGTRWDTTSTFFRCHSDSHPQKVAVFSPKPTFKDHIFIGEKASLLPPPGLAALLTHTLLLSFLGALLASRSGVDPCPQSRLEETPEITCRTF